MKRADKKLRREVFVLTPDEKRAVACVVGAFLLGLATMHYRAKHPRTPPPPSAKEQSAAKRSATSAAASRAARSPGAARVRQQESSGIEDSADDE